MSRLKQKEAIKVNKRAVDEPEKNSNSVVKANGVGRGDTVADDSILNASSSLSLVMVIKVVVANERVNESKNRQKRQILVYEKWVDSEVEYSTRQTLPSPATEFTAALKCVQVTGSMIMHASLHSEHTTHWQQQQQQQDQATEDDSRRPGDIGAEWHLQWRFWLANTHTHTLTGSHISWWGTHSYKSTPMPPQPLLCATACL